MTNSFLERTNPETLLDDVFALSHRLESRMPFMINLTIPSLIHSSRCVERNVDCESNLQGELLLSRERVDFPLELDLPMDIDLVSVEQDSTISIPERCNDYYQRSIIKVIEKVQGKTDLENDNFIRKVLKRNKDIKESNISDVVIPKDYADSGSFAPSYSMKLTMASRFFAEIVLGKDNEILQNMVTGIVVDSGELFSHDVKRTLSDTFKIIQYIQEKGYKEGVLEFLEQQMRDYISEQVNNNLFKAERGGAIGLIPTIKGFLNLSGSKYHQNNWAIIFYSLRCGAPQSALQFALENSSDFDSDVITALQMRAVGQELTTNLITSIRSYLTREVTSPSLDPYKALSLAVLCKYNCVPKNNIINKIEDCLWLNMQLDNDIEELKKEIKIQKISFQDPSNQFLEGQVDIILGEYNEAANFFLKQNQQIYNLHIVLAMYIAGLIDIDMIKNPIYEYAKKISYANPFIGIKYLSLLNDKNVKIKSIAKLIIECDSAYTVFEPLKNDIQPISKILLPEEQLEVMKQAAKKAEHRHQYDVAVYLYLLSEDYNSGIDLVCKELYEFIIGILSGDIIPRCIDFYEQMRNKGVNNTKMENLRILLHISSAYLYIKDAEATNSLDSYQKAMNEIEETQIFPTNTSQMNEYQKIILNSDDIIKKVLPDALIIYLKSLTSLYQFVEYRMSRDILKHKGDVLITFSSNFDISQNIQLELFNLQKKFH